MRLTVLGGCGAWPQAGQACSGFLVEHDGFRLLVDLGYATVPRLLERVAADQVDAVFISRGHPGHCADLNPLLRARALRDDPPPLPVFALSGAVDAVLALDRPGMLAGALALREFSAGSTLGIGPFRAVTRLLPHWVPNAGLRLAGGGKVLVYTGDSGPCPQIADLAALDAHGREWPRPRRPSRHCLLIQAQGPLGLGPKSSVPEDRQRAGLPVAGGGKQGGLNDGGEGFPRVGVGGYHHGDRPGEDAEEDLKAR